MSFDKEDSDFEVCLTSSEYTRILSVEKQSKKERQQWRVVRQELQKQIQLLKKQISVYQTTIKSKNHEIDQLSIQTLRLKKLRLANEDQIRTFKQQQLRIKQASLSQLQASVRQNKQIKQKRMTDENIIYQLKQQLQNYKLENLKLSEKAITRAKQFQSTLLKSNNRSQQLQKQLIENNNKVMFFERKATEAEGKLQKSSFKMVQFEKKNIELSKEKQSLEISLNKQMDKYKESKDGLQIQSQKIKEEKQELIKQRDELFSKHNDQILKMSKQLNQYKNKIDEFLKMNEKKSQKIDQDKQKFSSKIYKALEWVKQGNLQFSQLKQQIENMMVFEKEYEDIISQNAQRIKELQLKIVDLELTNKNSVFKHSHVEKSLSQSSIVIKQLSQIKVSKQENDDKTKNMLLQQQNTQLKTKFQKLVKEYDELVLSFNHTINDHQVTIREDTLQIQQLKNQVGALRLQHQFYEIFLKQGISKFQNALFNMKKQSNMINPENVMKILYFNLPQIKK